MTNIRITVEGIEALEKVLADVPGAVLDGIEDAADDIARDLRSHIVGRIAMTTRRRTGTLLRSPRIIVVRERRGTVAFQVTFPATAYIAPSGRGQYAFVLNSTRRFIERGVADLQASGRIRAHIEQAISRRLEQL